MQEAYTTNILAAGTTAPDFTLSVTPDQKLSLRNLRGRPLILSFYRADGSPRRSDGAGCCDPARLAARAPAVRS